MSEKINHIANAFKARQLSATAAGGRAAQNPLWEPNEDDILVGTLERIQTQPGKYGPTLIYHIKSEAGTFSVLGCKTLNDAIEANNIQEGSDIAIIYYGVTPLPNSRFMKNYDAIIPEVE